MKRIAIEVKSEIKEAVLPTSRTVKDINVAKAASELEARIQNGTHSVFAEIIDELIEKSYSVRDIADAALSLQYKKLCEPVTVNVKEKKREKGKAESRRNVTEKKSISAQAAQQDYETIVLNIGSRSRVGINHLIGSIIDNTGISRQEINKVEISKEQSLIKISQERVEQVLQGMENRKICGKHIHAFLLSAAQCKKNNKGNAGKLSKKGGRYKDNRFSASAKAKMARAR